jgi:hypothetical protein
VVTICDHLKNLKFSPVTPCAFTEHGAIMAASVLNSPKAVEVSVFVVCAFVKLRETIAGHKELARKIAKLERKLGDHDEQIMVLFEAIFRLYLNVCCSILAKIKDYDHALMVFLIY